MSEGTISIQDMPEIMENKSYGQGVYWVDPGYYTISEIETLLISMKSGEKERRIRLAYSIKESP